MRKLLNKIILIILKLEAKILIKKHNPFIIGITGNLGKTTTKDFTTYVYKKFYNNEKVRGTEKSLNSEYGVPLTIIGEKSGWSNPFKWFKIITFSFLRELFSKKYPKYLILEIGADHKGDIKKIIKYIKPDICILTAMQKNLVHGEFFKSRDEHVREKKYLCDAVKKNGKIIYNLDDEDFKNMVKKLKTERDDLSYITFGYNNNADLQIENKKVIYDYDLIVNGMEINIKNNLSNKKDNLHIKLFEVLGDAYEYALVASLASLIGGNLASLNFPSTLQNFFKDISLPKSRMRILKGINNSIIIDDSYNASPKAVENSINTLANIICKGKKILILGHMAELGNGEKEEHIRIANLAQNIFNVIIFIGKNNHLYNLGISDDNKNKIKNFNSVKECLVYVKEIISEYDLILCKGSQSSRIEKVVIELLRDYKDKFEVCRQEKEWEKR